MAEDGKVTVGVGLEDDGIVPEAEKAGRKAGDSFGEGFDSGSSRGIGKFGANLARLGAAAAVAGAAAGISVGKAALDAYAQFEQLKGGIETLYGESADQMLAYAQNAYMTAGLSANQYMETATGFAASLISSLEGDTAKAAEYANIAITDMSDNANKMGTSMESIQYAYQGFAKQNYTMLDNLKLGYGGTKSEMERLLRDAEAISGIHYDISSYADVVAAIHVIQEEMGIAGATAEEAMETIEGSINMTKAAWENWLVGLADSEADIADLTMKLVDAASTAAGNITERLGVIVASLIELFEEQFPEFMASIPALISEHGVEMSAAALDYFLRFVGAIVKATPDILKALLLMLASLVVSLGSKAGEFFAKGVEAIKELAKGFKDGFSFVLDEIARGIRDAIDRIKSFWSDFFGVGKNICEGLADGIASGIGLVARRGGEVATAALNSTRRTLDTHSPSKKTYEIGQYFTEGLELGVMAKRGDLVRAVGGIASDMLSAATPRAAFASATSSTSYTFGDVHLNASDAYGITAIEQLVHLIETA